MDGWNGIWAYLWRDQFPSDAGRYKNRAHYIVICYKVMPYARILYTYITNIYDILYIIHTCIRYTICTYMLWTRRIKLIGGFSWIFLFMIIYWIWDGLLRNLRNVYSLYNRGQVHNVNVAQFDDWIYRKFDDFGQL